MDKGVTSRLYGNYRGKVVENKDEKKFGRIVVWIPDLMPDIQENQGIWARPANNPIGGRNDQYGTDNHYMGSCMIPRKGAWVWIFFESGNINRPYYFAGLDAEQAKVLPENQVGTNFQDKWTLFKSHDGRAIVVSDDEDDERVEITGKKRSLTTPPSGDTASVYTIDGNQTTILFDEREGKEKILIRTYKGDFFHIDIDEQKLQIEFENDILIKTNGDFNVTANGEMNFKSLTDSIYIESDVGEVNIKGDQDVNVEAGGDYNLLASGDILTDGTTRQDQNGAAGQATSATEADPEGERNT